MKSRNLEEQASSRLRAYEREMRSRRTVLAVGTALSILFFSSFLIALVTGELDPILLRWGLPPFLHTETGAYADCTLPENRENPYCIPKQTRIEREWRDLTTGGGKHPFQLHE